MRPASKIEDPVQQQPDQNVQDKVEEKKSNLAQRIGVGLRAPSTAVQSKLQGPRTGATVSNLAAKTTTQTSAADAAREKLIQKNNEVRAKLESR